MLAEHIHISKQTASNLTSHWVRRVQKIENWAKIVKDHSRKLTEGALFSMMIFLVITTHFFLHPACVLAGIRQT